jgi:hypothetical protein
MEEINKVKQKIEELRGLINYHNHFLWEEALGSLVRENKLREVS